MKINKIFISHKFYQKKYDKDRAICYYLFQNYAEATYQPIMFYRVAFL